MISHTFFGVPFGNANLFGGRGFYSSSGKQPWYQLVFGNHYANEKPRRFPS